MRRKTALSVTVLAALLWLPGLAAAAPARGPAEILRHPRLLARYLRLTPEQVQQQRQLLQELQTEVEPLREQRQALREELRTALESGSPNACEVGELVVDLSELRGEVREALAKFDTAFTAILTPTQLERYENLKEAVRLLRGEDDD